MSKIVFAVVSDESGITAEVRGATTAELRALLPQVSVVLDAIDAQAAPSVSTSCCASIPVGANGQFLALLAAIIQKAATELPVILPYILQLLPLFAKQNSTAVGESVGANGQFLSILAAFLQKAAAVLPTILPEIIQLINLFGGQVNVTPGPVPTNS